MKLFPQGPSLLRAAHTTQAPFNIQHNPRQRSTEPILHRTVCQRDPSLGQQLHIAEGMGSTWGPKLDRDYRGLMGTTKTQTGVKDFNCFLSKMKTCKEDETNRSWKNIQRVCDVKEISANNELSLCIYGAQKVKDYSNSIKNDSQKLEMGKINRKFVKL